MGVVMVLLIGLSSLGYAIMSREDSTDGTQTITYAGLKFTNSNGFWATQINNKILYFTNLPDDVKNISIEGNYSFADYYNSVLYFVNINPATNTIVSAFDGTVLRMQEACLSNCTNQELPIKDCGADNIIVFKESSINHVYKQQKCVFIEGDFFAGADRFIYRLFNIA